MLPPVSPTTTVPPRFGAAVTVSAVGRSSLGPQAMSDAAASPAPTVAVARSACRRFIKYCQLALFSIAVPFSPLIERRRGSLLPRLLEAANSFQMLTRGKPGAEGVHRYVLKSEVAPAFHF